MLYKRSLQDDSGEIIDAIKDSLYDVPTNIYMSCLRVTTQNFKQSFKLLIIQKERLWERLRKYLMDKVTKTTWRLECSQKEKTTFTIFFFFFFFQFTIFFLLKFLYLQDLIILQWATLKDIQKDVYMRVR